MLKEEREVLTVADVTKKVKSGLGNGRGTLILAIVGICVSLCSSFMFCLASIGFDFQELGNSMFWSRWASMSITTLFAYVLVILHKDEINRLKEWYVENTKTIADKSKTAGEDFEEYLRELNLRRRIEWYKRKMNERIGRLAHKMQILELKSKSTETVKNVELKSKPTETVKKKIERYRTFVSDEYIEENKYALKTRSKPIRSVQVLSETQRGDNGEINFRSASAYYGGRALAKLVLSLCMTAAFSCVVVQNFETGINIASIVMTILTVLSLFVSVLSAIMAANGCYRNVYVPNLLFKLKILADYETWKEQRTKNFC